jgi:hypothetical protein
MIEIAPIRNNKKETINNKSQCHSSSNKQLYKTALETILEDSTTINTVADSAATGHFFPNEYNERNSHNNIEVVCANNQTMVSNQRQQLSWISQNYQQKQKQLTDSMK